jgi:hypothetical protein
MPQSDGKIELWHQYRCYAATASLERIAGITIFGFVITLPVIFVIFRATVTVRAGLGLRQR